MIKILKEDLGSFIILWECNWTNFMCVIILQMSIVPIMSLHWNNGQTPQWQEPILRHLQAAWTKPTHSQIGTRNLQHSNSSTTHKNSQIDHSHSTQWTKPIRCSTTMWYSVLQSMYELWRIRRLLRDGRVIWDMLLFLWGLSLRPRDQLVSLYWVIMISICNGGRIGILLLVEILPPHVIQPSMISTSPKTK